MEIEWHQLDHRNERLRARRPGVEKPLLASLASLGQQVPITVIRNRAEEAVPRYVVIDGFRRIRALKSLRHDTVEATVLDLPELDALLYQHAQRSGEDETPMEQAWLVAELSDRFSLSLEKLACRLGHSISWVSRRLALVRELPEAVQELVRAGKIGAHAAMRSLVPLARAKPDECLRVATAVAPLDLTSRQLAEVVEAWRRCSAEVKSRILEDPRLFLRAREERARTAACSEPAGIDRAPTRREPAPAAEGEPPADPSVSLLLDLDLVATIALSLSERWADVAMLDPLQRKQARWCLDRACKSLERLKISEERDAAA